VKKKWAISGNLKCIANSIYLYIPILRHLIPVHRLFIIILRQYWIKLELL
jgi:hypothetical protein